MNLIKTWLYNSRSFALPQSIMPSLLAIVLALGVPGFNIWLGLLATLGVCMVHLGGNLLDDYFDYKDELLEYRLGLRQEGEKAFTDKYPYLKDGSTTPRQLAIAIAVFFGIAILAGLIIFILRDFDWTLLILAGIAALLCFFYSAPPFKLGFHGLGELVIGTCFGPLLLCGVYESACGALYTPETGFAWHILALGVAIGLFVTNILYTHSFVERHVDDISHKKTLAVLLKTNTAGMIAYGIFLYTPFVLMVLMAALGYIHWAYCAVLIMLPQACWLMWAMVQFAKGKEVATDKPYWWLGPMDNWDNIAEDNRYYLLRWYTMRNINTGYCLIIIIVKIALLFI